MDTTHIKEVYITQSNFEAMVFRHRDPKDNTIYKDLYDGPIEKLLSGKELSLLAAFKLFFEDTQNAFEIYKKVDDRHSNRNQWVYGGTSSPAFHCNKKCQCLLSQYFNVEMPVEIKESNDQQLIERYRQFVKDNIELLKVDPDKFALRQEAMFFLKNPPKQVEANNTGTNTVFNYNLSELKTEINQLLEASEIFRNQSAEVNKLIRNVGYGTHNRFEVKTKKVDSVIYIWHHQYKGRLKMLLKEFFRVQYNPELKFDGELLSQLNFKPCSCCASC